MNDLHYPLLWSPVLLLSLYTWLYGLNEWHGWYQLSSIRETSRDLEKTPEWIHMIWTCNFIDDLTSFGMRQTHWDPVPQYGHWLLDWTTVSLNVILAKLHECVVVILGCDDWRWYCQWRRRRTGVWNSGHSSTNWEIQVHSATLFDIIITASFRRIHSFDWNNMPIKIHLTQKV